MNPIWTTEHNPVPPELENGVCRNVDPAIFFPDAGCSATPAKKICQGCPVAPVCLDYALDNWHLDGVWGGTSHNERRTLRRTLNRDGVKK